MSADGGPAFPVVFEDSKSYYGMCLRDYFAAFAMHALVKHDSTHGNEFGWTPAKDVAKFAYNYADAMLAQREEL